MGRIRSFRELEVYQLGLDLAGRVFGLTRAFPAAERFGLAVQILRSSRSVCANVGEAWRRRRYPKAFRAKLTDAEAEATETRVHLDIALACGYVTPTQHRHLDARYDALIGKLVRMSANAERWAVGRPPSPAGPPPRPPRRDERAGRRNATNPAGPGPTPTSTAGTDRVPSPTPASDA
jgi:four helix bundle protein